MTAAQPDVPSIRLVVAIDHLGRPRATSVRGELT